MGIITRDLNIYLSEQEHEDRLDAAIESKVSDLLSVDGDFYPFCGSNLSDSIGEASSLTIDYLAKLLITDNFEQAFFMLKAITVNYCGRMAAKEAEKIINNSNNRG